MANTTPIFPRDPKVGFGANGAASTNKTGTDTANSTTLFTAGENGSFVRKIRLKAMATGVAGIARIFINNGTDQTTATNNSLFKDVDLPAVADIDAGAVADIEIEVNEALPAGYKLCMITATVAAGSWQATVFGGDY